MRKVVATLILTTVVISLLGCQENAQYSPAPTQPVGNIVGGIMGGVSARDLTYAGSVRAVREGGVSFSQFINYRLNYSLDRNSLLDIDDAGQYAIQTGHSTFWRTASSSGSLFPQQQYTIYDGHVCRHFGVQLNIRTRYSLFGGDACRNDRGVWVVQ